jgi:hypothetical protein
MHACWRLDRLYILTFAFKVPLLALTLPLMRANPDDAGAVAVGG